MLISSCLLLCCLHKQYLNILEFYKNSELLKDIIISSEVNWPKSVWRLIVKRISCIFNFYLQDAFENEQGTNHDSPKLPGYMRPLRTGRRTPSSLITIEAFTLETKKKRNIWEEALTEKEEPRFKSSTMPAIRLSEQEVVQLQLGHMLHKPTKESITRKRLQASQRSLSDRVQPKPGACKLPEVKESSLPAEAEQDNVSSVFITQLPQKGLSKYYLHQSSLGKTHTKS